MVDHAPFFDVNRQVVLKVLNSCRIPGGTGVSWSKCVDGRLEYIGHLMYNEYVTGKYINRQIMMAVPKVILFVHKNGRI